MLKVVEERFESQEGELPGTLDELAREGARRLPAVALELEVGAYLAKHTEERDERGHRLEQFTSRILPPWMRRSPKLREVIPVLYRGGLPTGGLPRSAAGAGWGEEASGLPPVNITLQLGVWEAEVKAWRKRDLSDVDSVYVRADGVHVNVRLGEQDRLFLLVLIGARPDGSGWRGPGG